MEIVVFGIVLFIVGVAGTMVYDKYKDQIVAKVKESTTPRPKPQGVPSPARNQDLEDLLQNVKERARRGQATVNVQQGNNVQTMIVKELIKELERMKKNL